MLKNCLVPIARILGRPTVLAASSSAGCSRFPQSTRKLRSLPERPQCADSALCLDSYYSRRFSSPAGSGDEDVLLPDYAPRVGEALEVKRARLLYQSRLEHSLASSPVLFSLFGFPPYQRGGRKEPGYTLSVHAWRFNCRLGKIRRALADGNPKKNWGRGYTILVSTCSHVQ